MVFNRKSSGFTIIWVSRHSTTQINAAAKNSPPTPWGFLQFVTPVPDWAQTSQGRGMWSFVYG